MALSSTLVGGLNKKVFLRVLQICSEQPDVRVEVRKNHDNNTWWPLNVLDWRLRMVIAGWSTRISYRMIETYKRIVFDVNKVGYDHLQDMTTPELKNLIGSLGLYEQRWKYLKGIDAFIQRYLVDEKSLLTIPNDELIKKIATNVKGASYKVAQCAVLYGKGYYCGVVPVDSGMKDMLGPCLGLRLPSGSLAHEVMRQNLEQLINSTATDLRIMMSQNGYGDLNILEDRAPTWWAHLVLIYFKRLFCNRRKPELCPLRMDSKIGNYIGNMCDRSFPQMGGFGKIIIEGPDKVGKTTLAKQLEKLGYEIVHSPYNPRGDVYEHYRSLILQKNSPVVFDRTFISEITYGQTLRSYSRLSKDQFEQLMRLLATKGYVIFYLTDSVERIKERLLLEQEDQSNVFNSIEQLIQEYDKCISVAEGYIPVFRFTATSVPESDLLRLIENIVSGT